jgi:2-methylisocitrate lyase-like PEP mutase family enzyme
MLDQRDLARAFRAMHHRDDILVIPNVWDATSARIFVDAGFGALATPSAGISAMLGLPDGDVGPADEMLAAAARVARAVEVPVTVDAEAGYGLDAADLVDRLVAAGAVGCNIEDTAHRSGGGLVPVEEQAARLAAIREAAAANGVELVLNARIDSFVRGGTLEDALERAQAYMAAGADCVYPIGAPADALGAIAAETKAPVNAGFRPDGPSIAELAALGVRRVTFGPGLYRAAMKSVELMATRLTRHENPYSA